MNNISNLIVMLTHNDKTVLNAYDVFEKCKNSKAKFWGFKEEPLPLDEMKKLFSYMKSLGKTTFLEVIAYDEQNGLKGAQMAVECGVDVLMGTVFYDSINNYCKENNLKYMPFVGQVSKRPSILEGNIDDMIQEANNYINKGAYGIDLLGYRYTSGNPIELNKKIVENINAPICIAGSINSFQRLDEIKDANPWAFTIGGAFFENKFGENFEKQINNVCNYMENKGIEE